MLVQKLFEISGTTNAGWLRQFIYGERVLKVLESNKMLIALAMSYSSQNTCTKGIQMRNWQNKVYLGISVQ